MFWAQSKHGFRILCRFLLSSACALHIVECFSHSCTIHNPLYPLFIVWFPLLHELPLEPGQRERRQTLHCKSLFCRTFSRSSMLKFNQARQLFAHIDRLEILRCRSLNFILRQSCGTSYPLMRLQKLHSVTGLPSMFCLFLLSCFWNLLFL